jgi:hypothetical protein
MTVADGRGRLWPFLLRRSVSTEVDDYELVAVEGVWIKRGRHWRLLTTRVESTNCYWTTAAETDWHIALVKKEGEGEEKAIVVETTPRIRRTHPKWTKGRSRQWAMSHGWVERLTVEPAHPGARRD